MAKVATLGRRHISSSRGGVLVEAAIALPLFFGVLIMGAVASKLLSQRLIVWDGIRIAERSVAMRLEDDTESCSARALTAFAEYVTPYGVAYEAGEFCVRGHDVGGWRSSTVYDLTVNLRLTSGLCGLTSLGGTLCQITAERTVTLEGDLACPENTPEDLCRA